jgi:outer membrane protein
MRLDPSLSSFLRTAVAVQISIVLLANPVLAGQASAPEPAPLLQHVENSKVTPANARADVPRSGFYFSTYKHAKSPELTLEPAARARNLIRDGALYLSLYDAVALAIENNLDVEIARYQLSVTGTEPSRAGGGGNLRPLDFSVAESPTGVGGPGSPLLNSAAATVSPTTPTVNDLTSLNVLNETQTNLSVQSPAGFATGPNLPVLDPTLVGQTTYFQRSNGAALTTGTIGATPTVPSSSTFNYITANYAFVEGFSPGTQLEVDVNNAAQVLYGTESKYNPFSAPNVSATLTQPLLRGFGRSVNLRYIKIANLDQKISRLVFYQQLISTVYGVSRLYYDLVSLNENVRVKRETLIAAQKLLEDDKVQVEQGTLAPLELTRAQSLVTSSQLDLIQAEGLVHQEEVILKSQLARRGTGDPVLANLPIVPTDPINIPSEDEATPTDRLVSQALSTRPDLAQAALQVESQQISVKATQNAVRPEIDIIANYQNRGSSEAPFTVLGSTGTGLITSPTDLAVAGLRLSQIFQAGLQINLPLRNRAAEADAARDILQLRQAQARTQRLENQVREDVENSLIALRTARTALNAAIQSRVYQEQLVDAEKDRLSVGQSTNFLVVQQESYLAQARSTEVASRSVWVKARVALDRATGSLLDKNGISFDDSVRGTLPNAKTGQ